MYSSHDREKSRDRSRDRDRKYNARSPSEDYDRKQRFKSTKSKGKRVKFEGADDIRVFRKEDEPTARGLNEEDILKIKTEIEKEIEKSYDFNWEHYKHRDAQLESNSMKEQKEKEKALSEKLMAARELIAYFAPPKLSSFETLIQIGQQSIERNEHEIRIRDILGCAYFEITNQPKFEILNTSTASQCKIIKFDNDAFTEDITSTVKRSSEKTKPLKGILKMPLTEPIERTRSEPRQIDPQLIYLIREFKLNPQAYTKEKTEQLLKPYRDSGELDYLTRHKQVLEAMLKNANGAMPLSQAKSGYSVGRESTESQQMQGNNGQNGYSKVDKFRTVPCKYFNSPQGCSKVDNCTFIHDERYNANPTPTNNQPTPPTVINSAPPRVPPPYSIPSNMYGYTLPTATMQSMTPPSNTQNIGYYGHQMGYASQNPAYYNQNGMGNGYQANYQQAKPAGQQYMQNQQYNLSNPSSSSTLGQGYNPNAQYYINGNPSK